MSSDVLPWLEYQWSFDFPVGMFRAVLERLRGTPARLEEALRGAPVSSLTRCEGGKWSAQEHAGHLWVVDRLWQIRLEEFRRGSSALTPADMGNRATESCSYNDHPLVEILGGFCTARAATLAELDPLTLEDAGKAAHHPRLNRRIRLVDLCFFAAEHDDHHLATIHELLR